MTSRYLLIDEGKECVVYIYMEYYPIIKIGEMLTVVTNECNWG